MVRNLRSGPDWVSGTISKALGPVMYIIETTDGQQWNRHADQIKNLIAPAPSVDHVPETKNAQSYHTPPCSSVDPNEEYALDFHILLR